jgi:basic amino acid/polyamine antiporter, APA family
MELKKEIKLFGGISILTGIMIGSGIYAFGGLVLFRAGNSLGLSLIVWILGGVITLFSALTYGELGTLFPQTGGYYIYLKKAYGKRVAFLSGLMNFVLSSSGSIALLALIFSDILATYVLQIDGLTRWIAGSVIIILSVINYLGVKIGALVQKIFMIAKLLPMIFIIIVGLFMGTESVNLSLVLDQNVSFLGFFVLLGYAVVATLWSYEGWTNLNTMTGEMKNVRKDLPKALSISVLLVTVIYVLFIFSLYRIISYAMLINIGPSGYLPIAAMSIMFGDLGAKFVFIAVLISIFGALNGSIMVFPRVYFAMAEDDIFPKPFKKIDQKFQTPVIAIIGSAIMALILIFLNVEKLLTYVVLGGLIFNTLIFISVFIFRKRYPEVERPYKVWGYPYVPIIAIIGLMMVLVATIIESFNEAMIGFIVLTIGYFIYPLIFKNKIA